MINYHLECWCSRVPRCVVALGCILAQFQWSPHMDQLVSSDCIKNAESGKSIVLRLFFQLECHFFLNNKNNVVSIRIVFCVIIDFKFPTYILLWYFNIWLNAAASILSIPLFSKYDQRVGNRTARVTAYISFQKIASLFSSNGKYVSSQPKCEYAAQKLKLVSLKLANERRISTFWATAAPLVDGCAKYSSFCTAKFRSRFLIDDCISCSKACCRCVAKCKTFRLSDIFGKSCCAVSRINWFGTTNRWPSRMYRIENPEFPMQSMSLNSVSSSMPIINTTCVVHNTGHSSLRPWLLSLVNRWTCSRRDTHRPLGCHYWCNPYMAYIRG